MAVARMTRDILELLIQKNLLAEEALELIESDPDFNAPAIMYQGGVVEIADADDDFADDLSACLVAGPYRNTIEEARRDAVASWLMFISLSRKEMLARGNDIELTFRTSAIAVGSTVGRALDFVNNPKKEESSMVFFELQEETNNIYPSLSLSVGCVYPNGVNEAAGGYTQKQVLDSVAKFWMKVTPRYAGTNPCTEI